MRGLWLMLLAQSFLALACERSQELPTGIMLRITSFDELVRGSNKLCVKTTGKPVCVAVDKNTRWPMDIPITPHPDRSGGGFRISCTVEKGDEPIAQAHTSTVDFVENEWKALNLRVDVCRKIDDDLKFTGSPFLCPCDPEEPSSCLNCERGLCRRPTETLSEFSEPPADVEPPCNDHNCDGEGTRLCGADKPDEDGDKDKDENEQNCTCGSEAVGACGEHPCVPLRRSGYYYCRGRQADWPMPGGGTSGYDRWYSYTETVVMDHITGLAWKKKPYEDISWQDASQHCQDQGWRLPTKIELESLLVFKASRAQYDERAFSEQLPNAWTATVSKNDPDMVFHVLLSAGNYKAGVTAIRKGGAKSALCVRTVAPPRPPPDTMTRYIQEDEVFVRDVFTGLLWSTAMPEVTWENAHSNCQEMFGPGWRLPTAKELLTLVDLSADNGLDRALKVGEGESNGDIRWSSTEAGEEDAYAVHFAAPVRPGGDPTGEDPTGELHALRKGNMHNASCVRSTTMSK